MRKKPFYQTLPSEEPEEPQNRREKRKKMLQEKSKRDQDPLRAVKQELIQRTRDGQDRRKQRSSKEDRLLSLREQRLKREQIEREKANRLLHANQDTPSLSTRPDRYPAFQEHRRK